MDLPAAANALGTLGAVCWSVQLIPQIVLNCRRHNAVGLQPSMMMLWAWAGVPLGVYNIVKNFNIALQIQPQILTALSLVTWIQCYHYEHNWDIRRSLIFVVPIALIMAGIQFSLIFALRAGLNRDVHWPVTMMAILAAVFLALGVLRHYVDIYKHRTVRGISFLFVGIDAMGDLTSLLSILFQPTLDILGIVIYGVELVLWLGVFACGGYMNLLPWLRRYWRERRTDVSLSGGGGGAQVGHDNIAIHDLSSSTSVFRTPSNEVRLFRSRVNLGGTTVAHSHDLVRVESVT